MFSSVSVARNRVLSRWVLIGAILLVLTVVIVESVRFPGILTPPPAAALYASVFALTLIAYVVAAFLATRTTSPATDVAFTNALWLGAIAGALWWIEILEGNVWRLPGPWLALLYFGPALTACIAPGIAAALTAQQTGRFRLGLMAGVWSGMIGGLLTFLGGTIILWAFNSNFLQDPQNMQEFLRSHARGLAPTPQTYIVGDLLAGLIAHLSLIGIAVSAIVATIGAAIGRSSRVSSEELRGTASH